MTRCPSSEGPVVWSIMFYPFPSLRIEIIKEEKRIFRTVQLSLVATQLLGTKADVVCLNQYRLLRTALLPIYSSGTYQTSRAKNSYVKHASLPTAKLEVQEGAYVQTFM